MKLPIHMKLSSVTQKNGFECRIFFVEFPYPKKIKTSYLNNNSKNV